MLVCIQRLLVTFESIERVTATQVGPRLLRVELNGAFKGNQAFAIAFELKQCFASAEVEGYEVIAQINGLFIREQALLVALQLVECEPIVIVQAGITRVGGQDNFICIQRFGMTSKIAQSIGLTMISG